MLQVAFPNPNPHTDSEEAALFRTAHSKIDPIPNSAQPIPNANSAQQIPNSCSA
jgi:hypothetical protein